MCHCIFFRINPRVSKHHAFRLHRATTTWISLSRHPSIYFSFFGIKLREICIKGANNQSISNASPRNDTLYVSTFRWDIFCQVFFLIFGLLVTSPLGLKPTVGSLISLNTCSVRETTCDARASYDSRIFRPKSCITPCYTWKLRIIPPPPPPGL